ncbi:MAG: hypothetical protein V6Z81_05060 [Parvularculales bacterium]
MEVEFCVFSGSPEKPVRQPETGWILGDVDSLASCIELTALSENRIEDSMNVLENGIEQAARLLRDECANSPHPLEEIAKILHQQECEQTTRMAMAIIANAFTFHLSIEGTQQNIQGTPQYIETLEALWSGSKAHRKENILEHWRFIYNHINYWPIFKIASDVLTPIPNRIFGKILDRLYKVAVELDHLGATSQHDMCGRIFQRLISDRKFLATFYTLPTSATLLAEVAVSRLNVDWANDEKLKKLRIADFACGTGALLNAAYGAVLTRYRRTGGNDKDIHAGMIQEALFGTDIMPAASHLTATVLSSVHPGVPFKDTSIETLPYGEVQLETGPKIEIGALGLIEEEAISLLFDTGRKRVIGKGGSSKKNLELPHGTFDLVIMNSPFTSPTNHKLPDVDDITAVPVPSFAGLGTNKDDQKKMAERLKSLNTKSQAGHGNAGLASNFIDVANAKVKNGGVIALVLPAAFAQGDGWSSARQLLNRHYQDITIISIANTGAKDSSFSADTGMAEVLIIATKNESSSPTTDPTWLYINLFHRPKTMLEAVTVAREIKRINSSTPYGNIYIGDEDKIGNYFCGAIDNTGCAGIREFNVINAGVSLSKNQIQLPRNYSVQNLPLTQLNNLGTRGLVDRDINGAKSSNTGLWRGPFDITKIQPNTTTTYPVLWGHDATRETRMVVEPDKEGIVRPECDYKAKEQWDEIASCLHFSRDFRINSQPLTACMTPVLSIGGAAWPNFKCDEIRWEKPLVLWANTTLGLLSFWWLGTRQQLGRARVTIKRLPALVVLDVRQLSPTQLNQAADIFDELKELTLLPANEAWRDDNRKTLDKAVLIDLLGLDDGIMEALGLLRQQWCEEPSVYGSERKKPHS